MIKRFNEYNEYKDIELFVDKLSLFCEENLINLLDKGFSFSLEECDGRGVRYKPYINIEISNGSHFIWNDVKDSFIPFLTILNDEYNISSAIDFLLYNIDDLDVQGVNNELNNFFIDKDKIIKDDVDDVKYDEFNKFRLGHALSDYEISYININLNL